MPVSYSSPARNLFLLGTTGQDVVTNFFDKIDRSSSGYFSFLPVEVIKNNVDEEILIGLNADEVSPSQRNFGIIEKRLEDGTQEWETFVSATDPNQQAFLRDIHLDSNNNIIACGEAGGFPWIAKYSNGGVIDWTSTSSSGSVTYNGVSSDSSGQYYACGNTPESGEARAFVEKFDGSGNPDWGKSAFMLGRDVVLNDIAVNDRGHVVAVGYLEDDSADKAYIIKIDTNTGEVLWDRTLSKSVDVRALAITIDDADEIYIAGVSGTEDVDTDGFVVKYTAEGNMLWQSETDIGSTTNDWIVFSDIAVDNSSKKASIGGYTSAGAIVISRYESDGRLSWRREAYQVTAGHQYTSIDVDQSFTYFLFDDGLNQYDYTFGKVSATGNGLGDFEYNNGDGSGIPIQYVPTTSQNGTNITEKIGKLSDGSVRNDTSDLITYPFNANKLLFDDLATQVSNKRRQMDSADSFEYSGSPAIRPVDFPSLYLNAKNDAYNGTVVDPDSGIVGTYNTFGPHPGSNSVYLGGSNADPNTFAWQGYVDMYVQNTAQNSADTGPAVGTDLWTMEAWFYITEYPSNRAILMSKRHSQYTSNPETLVLTSTGSLEYAFQEGLFGNNGTTIPLNTWVHIAMAKNPANDTTTMVLVNGTHEWTPWNGMTTGHSDSSFWARLGWSLWSYTTNYQYLKGYISNFRFTSDNVYGTTTPGDTYTVPTSTLGLLPSTKLLALHEGLAYYNYKPPLDQTTCKGPWASPTNDVFSVDKKYVWVYSLPNYSNSPARGAKLYGLTDRVNRDRGFWEFNGVDDYITTSFPNDAIATGDANSEYTLEAWIYVRSSSGTTTSADAIMGHNSDRGVGMQVGVSNGSPRINYGARFTSNFYGPEFNYNEWRHIILTRDGTNGPIAYENGVEVSRTGSANDLDIETGFTPGDFNLGYCGPRINGYFDGFIGEARVYPRALTAAQVFQNYNATKTKYLNEAPDTAPKIGSGIVYDSNLLLNYDFGNKATFDPKDTSFTKITPPTAGNGANFGYHTRQLSNGFVTGEPWNNNGVVYWYDNNGNNIATIADPTNDGSWGYYVYSDRVDRVLINMPYYNDGTTRGFLYVYDGSGNLLSTIPRPEYNPGVNHPTWNGITEVAAIGEGKIAVIDAYFYDPGTTNERGALWIMDEDGTNQIRVLSPEVTPGSGTFNDFNYNVFIDNGYVYVYTSIYGIAGNTWTVVDFNGNIIRDFLPTEDGAEPNDFGYPAGAGEGLFLLGSDGGTVGIPAKTFIYDSTDNFNLVGTIDNTVTGNPYGGDYGTQTFHVYNGHIYISYDTNNYVRRFDLNGNFEKQINGPEYFNLTRLANGRSSDGFGYNNLVDLGGESYAIPAPYDNNDDGSIYLLKPTTVKNLSSSSYTGTITGPVFETGYFDFDGTNDYIDLGSINWIGGNTFSIEFWINFDVLAANTYYTVVSFGGYVPGGMLLQRKGDGVNSWRFAFNGNITYDTPTAFTTTGAWTHVVATVSSTPQNVYVNNASQSFSGSGSPVLTNPQNFEIGRRTDTTNQYIDGKIGEFRVYSRVLTATEVSQNFNATRSKYGV
jgi:hypothetical protein